MNVVSNIKNMQTFLERLQDVTPILFDGAFGTELFNRGIKLPNSALATKLYPEAVRDVHDSYVAAGSDIIGTNTFVASPLHLEMADHDADDSDGLVTSAVEIARASADASDRDIYVAGSIGPSPGAIETDAGGTDFGIPNQKVRDAHERVAERMAEAGIDLFCLETMFSATEAAIAVDVIRQFNLPIAVNCTYKYTKDRITGEIVYKTDWGHSATSLLDFLSGGEYSDGVSLLDFVHVLGINCGAEQHRVEHTGMPYVCQGIIELREAMKARGINPIKPMMAYPNAGIPKLDKQQQTIYNQSAEDMAVVVPELLQAGAQIIGGCCGTGPEHIRAFRRKIVKEL
jgi:methionine synthase I (cobalamin-dependent)